MAVALYPGAFKPPHRGHFNVVKSLAENNFTSAEYDLSNYQEKAQSLMTGNDEETEQIDKVIVFIGSQVRNGIDQAKSRKIWEIYKKHIKGNVEIYSEENDPLKASKAYARANPTTNFYTITGIRDEGDIKDLRRVGAFKNVPNVKGLAFKPKSGDTFRGTDFRSAMLSGNLDDVLEYFPKELSRNEILDIFTLVKSSIVAEQIEMSIEETLNGSIKGDSNEDYAVLISSLLSSFIDNGEKITPLPDITLNRDPDDTFFRPTAQYDPEEKQIVLYVAGRHPKDVVRSCSHELVHHSQNLNGRLSNIYTSNVNEDDTLRELEEEAYLKGNIIFRGWEDKIKDKIKLK